MRKVFVPLLLALFLLEMVLGCSGMRKRTDTQEPVLQEPPPAPSLNIKSIELRAEYLKNLLARKDLSEEERGAVNALLKAYRSAKISLSHRITKSQQMKIIRDLFNSMAILEYLYFTEKSSGAEEETGSVNLLGVQRRKIIERYLADDFKGVISQCIELEKKFGRNGFNQEINLIYVLSLAEEGRLVEAVNLGEETLRQLETLPDRMYLKSHIVKWHLELGNIEDALNLYDKLTDDLDNLTARVRTLRKKIAELDRPPALTQEGDREVANLENGEPGSKSVQKVLQEANELANNHDFQEAKLLLISYRNSTTSPSEIDMIDRAIKLIELAEEESDDKVMNEGNRKKKSLALAKKYLEDEEFEKAIEKIDEIAKVEDLDNESKKLRRTAVDKYLNKERNRAANLFLLAKNTRDPEQKKKYLIESREILKAIIDKYPSSDLNKRLKSHLKTIENELDKL
jgi:hypothetical protein